MMSNVCGLRKCWSVGLFKDIQQDDSVNNSVPLSNSVHNLDTLCDAATNGQSFSTLINHQDDVEETIYLDDSENRGFEPCNVKRDAFSQSTIIQEFSQPKVESEPTSFLSENEGVEILEAKIESEKDDTVFSQLETANEQENSVCHFQMLPEELILEIMSYIPLIELYLNIPLVCKTWKDFALSPILWQYLDFDVTRYLGPRCLVSIILKNCSLLKRLDLRHNDDLDDNAMLAIAKACPLLQDLTLPNCDEVNSVLKIFTEHCNSLQYVNIEGCNVTDDSIQQLAILPLKGLNVSYCVHLSNDSLKFITSQCSYMKAINFDGVQWITDEAVLVMVQHCHQTLEKLWLDGDELTDASVIAIAKCKNLKLFSISFCDKLTDESLMSVQHMKKLYSLRLRKGDGFTSTGFIQLFLDLNVHLMENKSGLQFLSLPECTTLDDEALKVLAESCPNLIHLDLSWCWDITDHGLRHVIVNCPRIERMTICGITDVQGECLIDLPRRMPRLQYLNASQCNTMSDDILYDIVNVAPDMIVMDYYSHVLTPCKTKQKRLITLTSANK